MNSIEEYKDFIKVLKNITGIEDFESDNDGLVSLRVDDKYNVNLMYIEASKKVLCFIELCKLKEDTSRNIYRDLLVGSLFGRDTGGGSFSLEPQSNTLIYNILFDCEVIENEPEEFISTLEKTLQVCDYWFERINTSVDSDLIDEKKEEINNSLLFFLGFSPLECCYE